MENQPLTTPHPRSKKQRGGQPGNQNARTHGFYSSNLTPDEISQSLNITRLEGVAPQIAVIRLRLQTVLKQKPRHPRIIREASRMLAAWYAARSPMTPAEQAYLRKFVRKMLESVPS